MDKSRFSFYTVLPSFTARCLTFHFLFLQIYFLFKDPYYIRHYIVTETAWLSLFATNSDLTHHDKDDVRQFGRGSIGRKPAWPFPVLDLLDLALQHI